MNGNRILYLCDRKKCIECYEDCKHTTDINHAVNFEEDDGYYIEQSDGSRQAKMAAGEKGGSH